MLAADSCDALFPRRPALYCAFISTSSYRLTDNCHLDKPLRQLLSWLLAQFGKDQQNRGVSAFADVNGFE